MTLRRLFISLLCACLFAKMGIAKEVVTFYATDFPPYEFENPVDPKLRGFDVETIVEAFDRVGIEAKVVFLPWMRIVASVKKGTVAGMFSCSYKKDRAKFAYFSDPISQATHSYIVKHDYVGPVLKQLSDATGLRNLVVAGYGTEKELKKSGVNFDRAMSDEMGILRLLERPYDTFYSVRENIEYLTLQKSVSDQIRIFDILTLPYHLCFSKKWPGAEDLLREFNRGLAIIIEDGTYLQIHRKYR